MIDYMEEYGEALKEDVCDEQYVLTMIGSDIENLKQKYGNEVHFFCSKCNRYIHEMNVGDSCPFCDTPRIQLKLVNSNEEYKKIFDDDYIFQDEQCVCDNCREILDFKKIVFNDWKCPKCKKIINKKIAYNEFYEEPEEFEYHCENCYESFTSALTEDVKCPFCNMVNENPEPITPEDMETDWEPDEEYYENLFDMED